MLRVASYLNTLPAEQKDAFILKNFAAFKAAAENSSGALHACADLRAAVARARGRGDVVRIRGPLRRCPSCASANIIIIDKTVGMCMTCGHTYSRCTPGVDEETHAFSRQIEDRGGAGTAQFAVRKRSVYSRVSHFYEFLNRLTGVALPRLSNATFAEIDKLLAERGLLCQPLNDKQLLKLRSYSFWRALFKRTLTNSKLSTYFHHIPFFVALYTNAKDGAGALDDRMRGQLVRLFHLIHTKFNRKAFNGRRRNLWSYSLIVGVTLNLYGGQRGRAVLHEYGHTLTPYGFTVKSSVESSGHVLMELLLENETEIKRIFTYVYAWPGAPRPRRRRRTAAGGA